jgi:RNA polymerase sigma factor FliA
VQLAAAISQLSEREQLILSLYYQEELTMKEISQIVGIVVSRVSQIHAASMVKLRASLSHLREGTEMPPEQMHAVRKGADRQQLRERA